MTRPTRPLAVALLLLAACKVQTDDLAPKTAAECAATTEKACGYKCVSWSDPATGCGEASCEPCPSGPAGEPATCDSANGCAWEVVCSGTLGDCDAGVEGCETDLASDASHCGACGHACRTGDACVGGVCPAALIAAPSALALDVDCGESNWLYWLDADGYLRRLDGAKVVAQQFRGAWRLAGDPVSAWEYVVGTDDTSTYGWIWEVDVTGVTSPKLADTHSSTRISGIASNGSSVYWTVEDAQDLHWFQAGTGGTVSATYPIEQPGRDVVTGTWGTYLLDGRDVKNVASSIDAVRTAPIDATRLAVGRDASQRVVVYVADEDTGEIQGFLTDGSPPFVVWSGAGRTEIDLVADGDGVYWTDLAAGTVRAFRNDGARYLLASGGAPSAICIGPTPGVVSFADGAAGRLGVYSAPK